MTFIFETKYVECKFALGKQSLTKRGLIWRTYHTPSLFKYLGSIIHSNVEIEGDVNLKIQSSWMIWKDIIHSNVVEMYLSSSKENFTA